MKDKKEGDELTGKKFDISGAGLKSEKNFQDEENSNNKQEEEEEEEDEIETVKFSETKNSKDDDEEFEVNFNDPEDVEKFTGSKTKESQNVKEKHFGENETIDNIKKELDEAEKKANEIDPETFYDIADFIISLLDSSVASGLKWWSKDSSHSAYTLPKGNKEKLTKQLAKILIKYNAKFSIELMFIVGLIIMYIPAFRAARAKKKELESFNVTPAPVQQNNVVYENVVTPVESAVTNNEVITPSTVTTPIKRPRRHNSRPRKP